MPAKPARSPTSLATAPTIGPRIAPRTAIPKTVPSSWPRSARGVDTVTQESAPAHVSALERPWRKRAMPTVAGESASASPKVASASSRSPLMTAFFGPTRPATIPPGMPPRTAPRPEGTDEQPGLELAEAEVVDVRRNERDQGAEQHRVEKHDRADDGDEAAHRGQPMSTARGRIGGAAGLPDHKKCTEPVAPSSGFPIDLRRSGCRSGSHQPPALRSRCTTGI